MATLENAPEVPLLHDNLNRGGMGVACILLYILRTIRRLCYLANMGDVHRIFQVLHISEWCERISRHCLLSCICICSCIVSPANSFTSTRTCWRYIVSLSHELCYRHGILQMISPPQEAAKEKRTHANHVIDVEESWL